MATTPAVDTIERRFLALATTWREAVAHHSSMSVRVNHAAYREISALGPAVIPSLLRDMESNQTHWFTALREITGENPVPASAAGNVAAMVQAWCDWARGNGLRW